MAYSRGGTGDDEATEVVSTDYPVTVTNPVDPANPPTEVASPHPPTEVASPHPPTEVASPHPPTEVVGPDPLTEAGPPYLATSAAPSSRPAEVVRYGPGVPAIPPPGRSQLTAEQVWRTGRQPEPPRRPARLRRLAGSALTVILLVAAGIVLYLRFHHAPVHVTGVAITQQATTTCGVEVTGRIDTNGSAGLVSYQWLFRPQVQAPQPLSQSVAAGQHAVDVQLDLAGQGHGSGSQTVTLQVLGPDPAATSARVTVSC